MYRKLTLEDYETKQKDILGIIQNPLLTHEQKVTELSRAAENLLTVLDEPEGIEKYMRCEDDKRCICNLFEGDAPYRPRYICPDYPVFLKNGSRFLDLPAPKKDIWEVLNSLLILYHNVPSITNYPVFIGNLDELLELYIEGTSDEEVKKALRLFLTNIDRTILDSFCHADIGPRDTRAGRLIMEVEAEVQNAVPNLTMRVSKDTPDEFILKGVECAIQ